MFIHSFFVDRNAAINESSKKNNLRYFLLFMNAILILAFVFRTYFTIHTTDEVFNIEQAFRTVQGNAYLVENWEFYQTGDSFLYPFLKIFYMITGSTEGIVFYTRTIFLIIQGLFVLAGYKLLSSKFDKTSALFACIIYVSAVSLKIFNMWYDTWEMLFRALGCLLILYVVTNSAALSRRCALGLLAAAGICHACMVYAYPTMIIVYVFVLIMLFRSEKKRVIPYLAGSIAVLAVFMIYALSVGVGHLFVFSGVLSQHGLDSTGRSGLFDISRMGSLAVSLVVDNIEVYRSALVILAADAGLFFLARRNSKYKLPFVFLMVIGAVVHLVENAFTMETGNTVLTYLSFYAPMLYFLISKESREKYKGAFSFIFASSYVAAAAYAFTALYGSTKTSSGARFAAILTLILVWDVIRENVKKIEPESVYSIVVTILLFANVFSLYYSASAGTEYKGTRPLDCDTVVKEGIFKGLIDSKETVDKYVQIERDIRSSVSEDDETVTCSLYVIYGYLMADLKPDTYNLWDSIYFNRLSEYYQANYGNPDIIIFDSRYVEYMDAGFKEFIIDNYELLRSSGDIRIYHCK